MTSIPQQAEALQRILEEEAVRLAKETGFIERERYGFAPCPFPVRKFEGKWLIDTGSDEFKAYVAFYARQHVVIARREGRLKVLCDVLFKRAPHGGLPDARGITRPIFSHCIQREELHQSFEIAAVTSVDGLAKDRHRVGLCKGGGDATGHGEEHEQASANAVVHFTPPIQVAMLPADHFRQRSSRPPWRKV